MAKGQKRSNKEVRKPKKDAGKKVTSERVRGERLAGAALFRAGRAADRCGHLCLVGADVAADRAPRSRAVRAFLPP